MSDYGYSGDRGTREQRRRRENREEDFNDRGRSAVQRLDSIQDPGKRYLLRDCIGSGVCSDVYEAIDRQAGILFYLLNFSIRSILFSFLNSTRIFFSFFFFPFHPSFTHRSSDCQITREWRWRCKSSLPNRNPWSSRSTEFFEITRLIRICRISMVYIAEDPERRPNTIKYGSWWR